MDLLIFNEFIGNFFKTTCFHLYMVNIYERKLLEQKVFWSASVAITHVNKLFWVLSNFSECRGVLWPKYMRTAVLLSPHSVSLYRNLLC